MKKFILNIPEYSAEKGLKIQWKDNYHIDIEIQNSQVIIQANAEGLISMAMLFVSLADKNVPVNYHVHLDDTNSLEEHSIEMIIQKLD